MAVLFDKQERIVPTWLAASKYLEQHGRQGRNLVLEMSNPGKVSSADQHIIQRVNARIVAQWKDLSIETVAGTIFPQGLYARFKRPAFYDEYLRLIARAKKGGTWGQYFNRMIRRVGPDGTPVNPLEDLVRKLKKASSSTTTQYQSTYELSPTNPGQDIGAWCGDGAELATYDPLHDRKRPYGGPCLSHLSFKITQGHILDLTAVYRSHHYCQRALGNLIGLGRLQKFVAKESSLDLGTLTCISTHAELDLGSWGGVKSGGALLESL